MKCTNPEIKKLISQYQLDLLPEDQKDRVEAHLLECESCLRELYTMDPALDILNDHPELLLKNLQTKENRISMTKISFNRAKKRLRSFMDIWKRHRIIGIAAPATALIAIILYIQLSAPRQYTDLAIIQKSPYERLVLKSPEDLTPVQKMLKNGLDLYEKELYTEAIAQFENIIRTEPDNAYARFYLGVSLLMTDDPKNAQMQFTRAVWLAHHGEDPLLLERCYWYLGNTHLLNNRTNDALQVFQMLAAMNGSFHQKAEKQISRILKLREKIGK